jgi:hypothetical protein
MISQTRRRAARPWAAAGFCAFLSLITVCTNLWLSFRNGSDYGGWAIGFLCFLPLCFYQVGATIYQMQREILELREQVTKLQRDNGR